MRAGLLSHPDVIALVNQSFVPTWILVDDAKRRAAKGDALARALAAYWEFPLDVMFLDATGRFVNKLNSFEHLRGAHSDVGHPLEGRGKDLPHLQVFLQHVERHFPNR